jgi:hypothetical protein
MRLPRVSFRPLPSSVAVRVLPLVAAFAILGCADSGDVPGFEDLLPGEQPGVSAAQPAEVVESSPPVAPGTGLPAGEVVDGDGAATGGDHASAMSAREDGEPGTAGGGGSSGSSTAATPDVREADSGSAQVPDVVDDGEPLVFQRPEHIRGIYLNAWAAGSNRRRAALIELARRTEINTFVIDLKDATGYVSHRTGVPLADSIGATGEVRIPNIRRALRELHAAGIYPIARIVIVKDPLLIAARPQLAVQDTAGGVWVDSKKLVWLNPFNREVWDYHVDLAREAAELGFPEIQWDYVRFPDAPRSDLDRAVFTGAEGRMKTDAIRGFLGYSRSELEDFGVEVTADVFGVTTSVSRDVGIGQVWETFIDQVDVALPMVYPSHYWEGSFGYQAPNAYPYEIVKRALEDALERSNAVEGAGKTRPWLQDFTLGEPRYEAPEVRAQIQATYDAGIQEWILWNPGSRYTEAALEPSEGWPEGTEPLMRIAGSIVPESRRFQALEEARVAQARAQADSLAAGDSLVTAADSSGARPGGPGGR